MPAYFINLIQIIIDPGNYNTEYNLANIMLPKLDLLCANISLPLHRVFTECKLLLVHLDTPSGALSLRSFRDKDSFGPWPSYPQGLCSCFHSMGG